MDRVVAARKLLAELVKSEQLEVRRVDAVARDLAAFAEQLRRPPSGSELEDWLGEHAQVSELYASAHVLEDLIDRHFTPPPRPTDAPDARHPELEQAIRDHPEDVAAYQVYADWLQEQGDPLGELITFGVAGDDERSERHRQVHGARLFGGLAKELLRRVHLHWKHGVVHAIEETVEHGMLGPYEWAQLLQLRVCGFVRSIALLQPCTPELDAVLAEHAPPTFRELSLYVSSHLPHDVLRRELGSLALRGHSLTLEPGALPSSLEQLELRVQVLAATAPIQLEIRELRITLTAPNAQHLAGARFPKLERLVVLQPGPDLAPMLPALDFPRSRGSSFATADSIAPRSARSPGYRSLRG
jgi:uncharacterized protein (TIGR02996 family)